MRHSRFSPTVMPMLSKRIFAHRHIGGEDRGEPAGLAHASSPVARRRPDRNSSRCSVFRR